MRFYHSPVLAGIALQLFLCGHLSGQSSGERHHGKNKQQQPSAPTGRIITKSKIAIPPATEVNFSELAQYELAHPVKRKKRFIEQGEDKEGKVKPAPKPVPPGAIIYQVPANGGIQSRATQTDSPVPTGYWDGVMDNNTLVPPDIQGAAGLVYVLETTNQEFKIYTKSGTFVSTLSIISLFSSTGGNNYFDPHCVYDAHNGRYLICVDGIASDGNSGLFIAASETNDPTGAWYTYGFDAITNPGDFLDYPLLGYNSNWLVLTVNDYIGGVTSGEGEVGNIYVMTLADVYDGALSGSSVFTDNQGYDNSPAETRDVAQTTEYLVADVNGNSGGKGYVQIESITGTVDNPSYSGAGATLGVTSTWDESTVQATQLGSGYTIEAGDPRIGNVICQNNTLWFSHVVPLPAGNPTYSGVDWWQVNPAVPKVLQFGRIQDPNGVIFYYYPSISVNAAGDALLGYCTSSPSTYVSAAYSFHASTDAANTMETITTYKPGIASYYKTLGGGRNRWGDFTGTTTDPLDNSFWNFSQWANTGNEWATVIAHVNSSSSICSAHAGYTYSGATSCSAPFTVNFINTSTSSDIFFWYFGDGTTSTELNPSHTYTTYGSFKVKLVAGSTGTCGTDSLTTDSLVTISSSIPCVVDMPTNGTGQTQTSCIGTLYDDGGPNANYSDNSNGVITISPTGASNVKLHFTQFAMETSYDFLYVYDGPNTGSQLLASLTGMNIPADITSSGASITIRQTSDEAVNYAGYAIDWKCVAPTGIPTAAFSASPTTSCTGTIQFSNLSTGATSWLWYFGDGTTSNLQNPSHNYTANASYTVSLVAFNSFGSDSVAKSSYITINKPAAPVTTGASSCNAGKFTLSSTSTDTVNWYAGLSDSIPVYTGNPFITPSISSSTTYYAEQEVAGPTYQAGPANYSFGNSSYLAYSWYEIFNVLKPCTLSSVYVYAQGAGDRTFQLLDNNANVLASSTITLPNGGSRITLNFILPVGNSYQLGIPSSSTINLLRNSSGTNYPYNDPGGYVSIIGNTADDPARYYYCYDWILQSPSCTSLRTATTATISSNMTDSISSVTEPTCYGYNNGSAIAVSTGGVPTVTYRWSNSQTGLTATNLSAGPVRVTATDANGCSASASVSVAQPTALSPGASVSNVSCYGGSDGSIDLTVTGGTPGYNYNWGNGVITRQRSGFTAGTYYVTITDNHHCTATESVLVTQPAQLSVSTSFTNSTNAEDNGTASVDPSGGTEPYTFKWSNGDTTRSVANLEASTYTVTVTDKDGCQQIGTVKVGLISGLTDITASIPFNLRPNPANTEVTVDIPEFKDALNLKLYDVLGQAMISQIISTGKTTFDISTLAAGVYSVELKQGDLKTVHQLVVTR